VENIIGGINMTPEHIAEILKTREEVAKKQGNTTELSLIFELLKMAEENKKFKENERMMNDRCLEN
jgi:hypothetical protein